MKTIPTSIHYQRHYTIPARGNQADPESGQDSVARAEYVLDVPSQRCDNRQPLEFALASFLRLG